jgi:hypothetical protein
VIRTVSFDCPACKFRHVGDTAIDRRVRCEGHTVIFDDDWNPRLAGLMEEAGTQPSGVEYKPYQDVRYPCAGFDGYDGDGWLLAGLALAALVAYLMGWFS